MRKILLSLTAILILLLTCSWGFYAHYRINRLAVFTLPRPMAAFYENNIEYITEHAVSADKRRYVDSTEGPRHFLDADHYGKNPFAKIPQNYDDAAIKYTADSLNKYGILPWNIGFEYDRLVKAFKTHDTTAILSISANLGHYVADAHVPLHLTQNYNGQLSNQTGIHAFWESRIPELYGDGFNWYAGKAHYINDPLKEAFVICRASFNEVDSVLLFERLLTKRFPAAKKYEMVKHGSKMMKDYSAGYSRAYQLMLKGMIERRMRASIRDVGSYWYSAWVDAGQPDLNNLIKAQLPADEMVKIRKEENLYKAGKSVALTKVYAGKNSQTN